MQPNEYLSKLFSVMQNLEGLELFSGATKLSQTEFRLLREVFFEGRKGKNIISSELARRLGITRSAVSQIVSKLEREDIVRRVASPTDRKIAYICFSDRAQELYEEQCRSANAFIRRVVREFGEGRMNEFIALCEDFSAAVNKIKQQDGGHGTPEEPQPAPKRRASRALGKE